MANQQIETLYSTGANALLIAQGPADEARKALEFSGIRICAQVDFAEAIATLSGQMLDLIVIEAAGEPDFSVEDILIRADAAARERRLSIVAAISNDQLDLVDAHLFRPQSRFLCNPTMSERLGALALARAEKGVPLAPALHDVTREAESVRLQRLNEEVARIAETLARLTRGEEIERGRGGVRDPGNHYRGPSDDVTAEATAQEIRTVIRARRLRAQFFQDELFADPAWDMLLDLFAAGLEYRQVSVSSLCIAAAVPPTTALRWIGTMHDAGLFERQADPSDRRRAYIGLSLKGVEGMRAYVSAAKRAGLNLA